MGFRTMMKKAGSILLVSMLLATPVMAGGECGYGTDDIEDECFIMWMDNADSHWCACLNHSDENGKSPITWGPEPHNFVDGRCDSCGREGTDSVVSEAVTPESTEGTAESADGEVSMADSARVELGLVGTVLGVLGTIIGFLYSFFF